MSDADRESVRVRVWRYKAALHRVRSQIDRECHDGVSDVLATALVAYIDHVLGDEDKPEEEEQ